MAGLLWMKTLRSRSHWVGGKNDRRYLPIHQDILLVDSDNNIGTRGTLASGEEWEDRLKHLCTIQGPRAPNCRKYKRRAEFV